jgi:hypothetical protein
MPKFPVPPEFPARISLTYKTPFRILNRHKSKLNSIISRLEKKSEKNQQL